MPERRQSQQQPVPEAEDHNLIDEFLLPAAEQNTQLELIAFIRTDDTPKGLRPSREGVVQIVFGWSFGSGNCTAISGFDSWAFLARHAFICSF